MAHLLVVGTLKKPFIDRPVAMYVLFVLRRRWLLMKSTFSERQSKTLLANVYFLKTYKTIRYNLFQI